MNISNERIEAASEPMRRKYCLSTNCTASNCECRAMTRLILTADSPALADAELRGKVEEAKAMVAAIETLAHHADEPGCQEQQPYRDGLIAALVAVKARLAAIEFAFHARPKGVAMFHPDQEGKAT